LRTNTLTAGRPLRLHGFVLVWADRRGGCNVAGGWREKGSSGRVIDRESEWAALMRAATRGDTGSYHRLLRELAPLLRGLARRGFTRHSLGAEDVEDVVQETLLALHLKRNTWNESQPLLPWIRAIARNKMIDTLRRRSRQAHQPLDDFGEWLMVDPEPAELNSVDAHSLVARLTGRQREIVMAISIEGESAREVAQRLGMTQGAVRVALHRALRSLAKTLRAGST
jgi:RNA polymerase sigma-70 factor (ECF subfamily)